MTLQSDSTTEIRDAIRRWVDLLAQRRFDEAANDMASPESQCSASLLREAIGRYSRIYREGPENQKIQFLPEISSPYAMDNQGENLVLYPKVDSTIVEYDLPIAGDWSDLTVKFCVKKQDKNGFAVSLVDIRVL